jgi:Trk-type K+ transport system membrane component
MSNFSTLSSLFKRAKFRRLFLILFAFSLFFGSLVVPMERNHPEANIITYFDSVWWTVSTITTVGYGDLVPVTDAGKILGIILQFFGVLMYGSMIAMIGKAMNRRQEEYYQGRVMERLDSIEDRIDKLNRGSEFLIKKH